MLIHIIRQYDFNLVYANKLVEDLNEIQMTTSPCAGLENHPAFTLGHLVTGSAMTAEDLGEPMDIPDGWVELFIRNGPGDPRLPLKDPGMYPDKKHLLDELKKQHEKVKILLLRTDETKLSVNIKWRFNSLMPTTLDLSIFMCINHEAMHLGQLAAWRRAMKLPSALEKIR